MLWQRRTRFIIKIFVVLIFSMNVSAASSNALKKATGLFNEKKNDEAKKIFTNIVDEDSRNSDACFYLGRIYLTNGDYDESIEWLNKAVNLNPGASAYHQWLGNAYMEKGKNTGKIKMISLSKKMKREWERAIELDADNIETRLNLLKYYIHVPFIFGGSQKKAYEQAVEIEKRNAIKGHEAYIEINTAEKEYELAEKEYIALIELDPENFDFRQKFVLFLINIKNYEKAYKKLVKMIKDYPDHSWPYFCVGYMALTSNKYYIEAEKCMQQFFDVISKSKTENYPDYRLAEFHYMLGTIYKKNGKTVLARNEYIAALNLSPTYEEAKEALLKLK